MIRIIGILGHFYVQKLVACNFANNRENRKRESCLKIIIPFLLFPVVLSLRDASKKHSE